MKYRYVLKNKHTGKLHFKIYSLESIEKDGLKGLFDIENYEILSRDRFTGFTNKNEKDIYNNDTLFRKNIGDKYEVVWKDGGFLAHKIYDGWLKKSIKDRKSYSALDSLVLFDLEIIGNIHEKTTV